MELQSTALKIIAHVLEASQLSAQDQAMITRLTTEKVCTEISMLFARTRINEKDLQIIEMLANGYTSKEIGQALSLSPRTVEAKTQDIKSAFGCKNVPHLVKKAIEMKLI